MGARPTLITWPPIPQMIDLFFCFASWSFLAISRSVSAARILGRLLRNVERGAPGVWGVANISGVTLPPRPWRETVLRPPKSSGWRV